MGERQRGERGEGGGGGGGEGERERGRERETENPKPVLSAQRRCGAQTQETAILDHDPSQNQESDALLSEPPRHPPTSFRGEMWVLLCDRGHISVSMSISFLIWKTGSSPGTEPDPGCEAPMASLA